MTPHLDLEQMLCFSLYAASHAMNRIYKPLLEPLGLTYPQYLVLVALWRQDGRSVKELGQALQLDSGTLTPLLKRLEQAGHVTRTRDPADERRVRVNLTGAGRALQADARSVPEQVAAATGCGHESLGRLTEELQDLRARLVGHAERAETQRRPEPELEAGA